MHKKIDFNTKIKVDNREKCGILKITRGGTYAKFPRKEGGR